MANSDEALALRRRARRRLVGAIALVLALVIVPPLIMDLEPKPVVTNLTVEIPQQDLVGLKPPTPPTAATPTRSPPPEPAATTPADVEPSPPAVTKPAPTPKREPSGEGTGASGPSSGIDADKDAEMKRAEAILNADAYVVPVGAFMSKENAKQVEARLAKAGVRHYTENVATTNGEQTRVRAGPFPTKAAAEDSRDKLKSLGLDPGPVTAQ